MRQVGSALGAVARIRAVLAQAHEAVRNTLWGIVPAATPRPHQRNLWRPVADIVASIGIVARINTPYTACVESRDEIDDALIIEDAVHRRIQLAQQGGAIVTVRVAGQQRGRHRYSAHNAAAAARRNHCYSAARQ